MSGYKNMLTHSHPSKTIGLLVIYEMYTNKYNSVVHLYSKWAYFIENMRKLLIYKIGKYSTSYKYWHELHACW
jgi:hypothetical protein